MAEGTRRRLSGPDLVSIRAFGLRHSEDSAILEWAAKTGHVIVTHDVSTMTAAAEERLRQDLPMPGLILVPQKLGIGEAVRRLSTLLQEAKEENFEGRVLWL
ncbi:MAG: DUF5615 family PIN-like protein [Thermoanaerobaculia bacterium]